MSQQRQPFRFRLPWLPAAPSRPTVDTQTPAKPAPTQTTTTTTTVQRPPFRPAGVAPTQPPPSQAPPPPRTESQPSSTSRAPQPASQTSSQTSTPQTASQAQSKVIVISKAPSPPKKSQATTQESTQPPSPSSQILSSASQPSSPSRKASQLQPAIQTASQPQSSSATQVQPKAVEHSKIPSPKKSQTTTQESSQPPTSVSQIPSSPTQPETKPGVSQALSKEPQPNAEITSQAASQNHSQVETTSQPDKVATQLSQASGSQKADATASTIALQKLILHQETNSSAIEAGAKHLPESEAHLEEPKQGLGGEQMQAEKQEAIDRKEKEILTTSDPNQKHVKTAISTQAKDTTTVSIPHQKPTTSNGERVSLHKGVKEDISKFVQRLTTKQPKQFLDEKPLGVITITGENRGATMQLGSERRKKEESIHIHRSYKINPDESTETTTDGEGTFKGRRLKDGITKEEPETKAYINSNIQSINNAVLFNSSVTERNPGVQLALSHNTTDQIKTDGKAESIDAYKAEFSVTPAQKHTFEPTVRRRCLRGLFMESSDSDPDNPKKPQRHGCRYNCRKKGKDDEKDVL